MGFLQGCRPSEAIVATTDHRVARPAGIPSTPTAPDHDLSDAELANRAAAGDERAFEALDRRHRAVLLRQCTRILRNGHDAEEAVQGALLKAYRAFSRGRSPESVLPWLMTIARNECFDMIRARRRTEELPLDIESGAIRPDELVVRREDARVLHADIAELPEAQRAALVLRAIADLPHAEIAERLAADREPARPRPCSRRPWTSGSRSLRPTRCRRSSPFGWSRSRSSSQSPVGPAAH
jgi:RNA polymerase sigma-70 factor (ECF subfamily)